MHTKETDVLTTPMRKNIWPTNSFASPGVAYLIGWVDREAGGKGQAAVRGASRAFKLANAHSGGGVKGTSRHLRQGIKKRASGVVTFAQPNKCGTRLGQWFICANKTINAKKPAGLNPF
jgi:hypothetical protein